MKLSSISPFLLGGWGILTTLCIGLQSARPWVQAAGPGLTAKFKALPLLCHHVAGAWRGNWCRATESKARGGRTKPIHIPECGFCSTAASTQCETMSNIQTSEKLGMVCLLFFFFLRVCILLCPRVDFNTEKIICRSKINSGNQLLVENRHPLSSRTARKVQPGCPWSD